MPGPLIFLIFWGLVALSMGAFLFFRPDIMARRTGTTAVVFRCAGVVAMIAGVVLPLGLITGIIPNSTF